MARPATRELTERELDVMQVYWELSEATAAEARDALCRTGLDLTYTTVATLVRLLADKGLLVAVNSERPFRYRPARTHREVAGRLLGDMVARVFRGSRAQLMRRLVDDRPLTADERRTLEAILADSAQGATL